MRFFKSILLAVIVFAGISAGAEPSRILQAAQAGAAAAQFRLGACYYYGEDGVKQDYKQAVFWYRRAAEQGNVRAQIALGLCYCRGEGVSKSLWKGAKLLLLPNGGLPKK